MPALDQTVAAHGRSRDRRRSARRNSRSAGRSSRRRRRSARRRRRRPPARGRRVGARQHDPVVGREELAQQVGGRLVAGQARVEPAEDELDHPPRELGRDEPLGAARGTCRRSARASGAARRWPRSARTARGRGRGRAAAPSSSSSIVRATSTGSVRAPGAPSRRGSTSPTPRSRGPSPGAGSRPSPPRRTAARVSRTSVERVRGRDDGHAVAAARAARRPPARRSRLTSWPASHAYGVTCAMLKRSATRRSVVPRRNPAPSGPTNGERRA